MINCIESNRLVIRSTKKVDADFCINIWQDDEMGKYMSDPPRNKAGDYYLSWKESVEIFDGCCYFVAVSKKTGNYIGTCSAVPSDEEKSWSLGYSIHKSYWLQSYATEMIKALVDFCYNNGGCKITASVAQQNPGSNALLRKHLNQDFILKKKVLLKSLELIYHMMSIHIELIWTNNKSKILSNLTIYNITNNDKIIKDTKHYT
ncbi:MAG: GNAT family N-acetyltransferase [Clostridiales bacterium]|nr:GNAT family N-acetyltransferase [Clostridiales bacterium]